MPAPFTTALTPRQQAVLNFLADFDARHGYPATFRDVQQYLGIRSVNGVLCHLKALERKGVINRDKMISRGIRLVDAVKAGPRVEHVEGGVLLSVGDGVAQLSRAEALELARKLWEVATRPLAG